MRVVIIEDEKAALEQLSQLLLTSSSFDIEIVESIDSVEDSIEFFNSQRCKEIDLVFMDIHLSDGYSFSIFKHVEVAVPIIFTTAYDEYAFKAFEVNCLDYILKPISKEDVERIFAKIKVVSELTSSLNEKKEQTKRVLAMDGWRTVPLELSSVAFFYKDGAKVKGYNAQGKSYLLNLTLEKLDEMVDSNLFVRANRQFIISRSAIINVESYEGSRALLNLTVTPPENVIISRTKVAALKQWLCEV